MSTDVKHNVVGTQRKTVNLCVIERNSSSVHGGLLYPGGHLWFAE